MTSLTSSIQVSEEMTPLAKDDPRIIAWETYKATEAFTNTRNWALHKEHVDGSLWAAFVAGMEAAWEPRQFEAPEVGLAAKFIEALERSAGVQGLMIDADDCSSLAEALAMKAVEQPLVQSLPQGDEALERFVDFALTLAETYADDDEYLKLKGLAAALVRSKPVDRERLREWALDKAATHHRLAHENKDMRSEHIASSSAYRNLADELSAIEGLGA